MSTSHIAIVADAVRDAINAAAAGSSSPFSAEFVATRVWLPLVNLTAIQELAVVISPRAFTRTRGSRNSVKFEYPLDIGVTKLLSEGCDPTSETANDEIDPLMQLVEELANFFEPGVFEGTGYEVLGTPVIPDPIYDPAKLHEAHQFLAKITVTFVKP